MNKDKKIEIYKGDSKLILPTIKTGSISLIYADPPYYTQTNHTQKEGSFEDRWKSINTYIQYMKSILIQLHRILTKNGSLYWQCDYRTVHYIRLTIDKIFGRNNFQNEIIWWYCWGAHSNKRWNRKHDNILFYSKSSIFTFNFEKVRTPYISGKKGVVFKGRINNPKGKYPEDVWYIPTINSEARERQGYPTQKPLELVARIIKASSNKNDIVLDPFCGSGTTLLAASKLGRRCIGIDKSEDAIKLTKRRLKNRQ